jgi:EAL domain-containing protein (putative c-di-GMP-specific phosphodiesterase class I)
METALRQMESWLADDLQLTVSVNIDAHHLQRQDFLARLQQILASHPAVSPRQLEIEILETAALQDLAQVSQRIAECRKLGVQFAIDDFGTGYSSSPTSSNCPCRR